MYNHRFKRSLGQNFLQSEKLAKQILSHIDHDEDNVIEIGPGKGIFTEILLQAEKNVYAVELDRNLYEYLEFRFELFPKFKLVKKDFLKYNIESIPFKTYQAIGSLPFNISKKIINKFFHAEKKPSSMLFILQKEVAEDYTAKAPKSTFLANLARIYGKAEYIMTLGRSSFHPKPKVESAVVKFTKENDEPFDEKLARFIKIGFTNPRKTLLNNISNVKEFEKDKAREILKDNGIKEKIRAAEMRFEDWKVLFDGMTH
jgi:16S rRNA (adenine1518-N6/adenine1519-N6)-dimethyltransferase